MQPSNCSLGHLSQRNGNLYSHTRLYMKFQSIFFFLIAPKRKQLRHPSTGELSHKLWSIHSLEHCLTIKKQQTTDMSTTWRNLHFKFKLYKVRKANLKGYVLFDSIYKRFVKTKSMKSRLLVARSQRWERRRRNVTVFSWEYNKCLQQWECLVSQLWGWTREMTHATERYRAKHTCKHTQS